MVAAVVVWMNQQQIVKHIACYALSCLLNISLVWRLWALLSLFLPRALTIIRCKVKVALHITKVHVISSCFLSFSCIRLYLRAYWCDNLLETRVVRGSCAIIFDSIKASPFEDFSTEGWHGKLTLLSGKFSENPTSRRDVEKWMQFLRSSVNLENFI